MTCVLDFTVWIGVCWKTYVLFLEIRCWFLVKVCLIFGCWVCENQYMTSCIELRVLAKLMLFHLIYWCVSDWSKCVGGNNCICICPGTMFCVCVGAKASRYWKTNTPWLDYNIHVWKKIYQYTYTITYMYSVYIIHTL